MGDHTTRVVEGDHSAIIDPRERWEAYDLENYTIDQTRTCECLAPYSFTVVVQDREVLDVLYDPPGGDPAPPVQEHENLVANTLTIDALFDLIERETPSAAHVEVDYHPRYGYPIEVFIDPDERAVDEEIILSLENLRELVN